ncbi:MAG: 2Fe-2S iron-sulfur cluster binding domain-containing protein [Betaproteobacteria bacterium]|nr:MAG: 2Fe-2S iron-sulfur cluster binding domain-containing protein [Betaproteobacteria bacterium]
MQFVITIEDLNRRLTVERDEILLAALLARGVRFAYSCQSGNCGACKCHLVAGQVRELAFSDEALSRSEREQGLILACRSCVQSDLVVKLAI